MPRAEAGSLKAMSNKAKSVGLQKLKFWCQLCQKQCRDENGFKCHTQSESHLQQIKLFAENSKGIIDDYSRDFCKGFLEILSHRHSTTRVQANKVYQEYIAFKEHIHMNATIWNSLTEFCIYLGKEGKAVVEETDKGWFIQYIDRDPRVLARQAAAESKQKAELDDEERARRMIATQIQAAEQLKLARERSAGKEGEAMESSSGATDTEGSIKKIEIKLTGSTSLDATKKRKFLALDSDVQFGEPESSKGSQEVVASSSSSGAATGGVLEQIRREEEQRKVALLESEDKRYRMENWLHENITVRILNKKLSDGRFYKLKGTVMKVIDNFIGEVQVDGALVRLDQTHLETVLPKANGSLLIVNGRCRGMRATLLRIHEDKFNCDVRIEEGAHAKLELTGVDYEDVCKLAT
jgi:DNA/RNA-binding protein KIN17